MGKKRQSSICIHRKEALPMNDKSLYDGIGKIAAGYFLIYFDFNINTVSILPSFIGYFLFLSAIADLAYEENELVLLRPFAAILILWHSAAWLLSWGAVKLDGLLPIADIVIGLINLYFHFQLLTNLAAIARKYRSEEERDTRLLHCRTFQTVILTAAMMIDGISDRLGEYAAFISGAMIVVYLIAGIVVIKTLIDFRRYLTDDTENT